MPVCLIIEDHPVNQMAMERQAKKMGFEAVLYSGGEAALEYCKGTMPDLVLLDNYISGTSGIDFLKKLRTLPDSDKPYVIFCSVSSDKEEIEEAMEVGADLHLSKPIMDDQLMDALKQIEERKNAINLYQYAIAAYNKAGK